MYMNSYKRELKLRGILQKAAFTLIELLVVIAIISLLVSILLPSLQAAKDLAKKVACQANIRNLLMATAMYRSDSDGYWPPAFLANSSGQVIANWYDNLVLGPYLEVPIVEFCCPACETRRRGSIGYSWPLGPGAIGHSQVGWPYVSESMIQDSAGVPAFMDIGNHTIFTTTSWTIPQIDIIGMAPRHDDYGNVGYCDSHVSALAYDEWWKHRGFPEKWLCPWIIQ